MQGDLSLGIGRDRRGTLIEARAERERELVEAQASGHDAEAKNGQEGQGGGQEGARGVGLGATGSQQSLTELLATRDKLAWDTYPVLVQSPVFGYI